MFNQWSLSCVSFLCHLYHIWSKAHFFSTFDNHITFLVKDVFNLGFPFFVFYIIQYYHWICWLPTLSITLNKYCLNKKVFSKFKKRYFPQKQTKIEYWLRGLFLASSLINSSCLPNTRHYSKYEKIIYKSALEQYFTVGENWRKIYLWNLPSFATKIVANFFWM